MGGRAKRDLYIRSNNTGRYLNSGGTWSALRCNARDFLTASAAKNWCIQQCLLDVEIFVVRDDLVCMRVPVHASA
jgi:hypothetical protein